MKRTQHGFSLIELIVTVGVIAILAMVATPAAMKGMESARRSACVSNLRLLHGGIMTYAADNGGTLPMAYENATQRGWDYFLGAGEYVSVTKAGGKNLSKAYGCPSQRRAVNNPAATTYGMNGTLSGGSTAAKLAGVVQPAGTMLMADGTLNSDQKTYNVAFWQSVNKPQAAHGGCANILYVDGHVAQAKPADIALSSWPAGSPQWVFWTGRMN